MDEFRYLSLFLSIKDFISLTSCNKNLRRLYFEKGTIWKNFLERDFCYKYHPSYDVERYKICLKRKNINFSERKEKDPIIRLTYIDFDPNFLKLRKSLENWGLVYENRPVISQHVSFIFLVCISIFSCDYEIPDMIDFTIKSMSNLIKDNEHTDKYKNKSYDLLFHLAQILYLFEQEESIKNMFETHTIPDSSTFRSHPNYEKAKLMWQELGF